MSRGGGEEKRAHASAGGLLLRAAAVATLTLVLALVILVRPLPEPSSTGSPDPSPSAESGVVVPSTATPLPDSAANVEEPTSTGEPISTATPSSTAVPTALPSPSPTVLVEPTATNVPPATVTPTPETVMPTASATRPTVELAGRVEQGVYQSRVTGQQESYRVYLPPGYDQQDRRFPILYLLHGWPYDESHWDLLGVDEVADARILEGVLPPFIIVLPGADKDGLYVTTSGGAQSFEEQLVNELMPHIDATYRSLQTRDARAIGGISRGGVWSLEIAFRHPDAFGIVGAHSPALSANRAPPIFDPFTLMERPGVENLRIYLSAGDADWARRETVELHEALEQRGIGSELAIHEGVHHDPLWAEHIDDYLRFYAAGW